MLLVLVLGLLMAGGCHGTARGGYRLLDHPLDIDALKHKSELYMNTLELVGRHGYPVETHVVTSEDGYIITTHRIPHGRGDDPSRVRTPVILMHGMTLASDTWVLTGPDSALGFILADSGYDVWMPNARGNFYSWNHETLSPNDPKYWTFSWHEMGVHDLPAVIDYVLQTTNQQQLLYIGHSMGSTMFFALLATKPKYNEKVKLMVALAPAVYLGPVRSVAIRSLQPFSKKIADAAHLSGQLNMAPRTRGNINTIDILCNDRKGQMLCEMAYELVFGSNRGEFNSTLLPSFLAHFAGASIDSLNHYTENLKSNRFQWYDKTRNGRAMPLYDLSKVVCPVSLHYGDNDILVNPQGVLRLSKELPNVVALIRIKDDFTVHNDFVIGLHAKQLIYEDVINIMNKYH